MYTDMQIPVNTQTTIQSCSMGFVKHIQYRYLKELYTNVRELGYLEHLFR